MATINPWLLAAGALDCIAAVAHLACIGGGPAWYRFFGAGERMARMVERGEIRPAIITFGIATILFGWSAYALSGGCVLPRLPFLRPVLAMITATLLLRALALPIMLRTMPDRSATFRYVSSAIVLTLGVIHGIGLADL